MLKEGVLPLDSPAVKVREMKPFEKGKAKVFRPKQGITYRIKFVSGDVVMRLRHYNPMKKRYVRCLSYQGYCPCCVAATNNVNNIKKASETYGANILVYEQDQTGRPIEPTQADVHFWAFGGDKFVAIRSIIQEWGNIEELDLTVNCTDEQFQKVTISPARNCLYLADEATKAALDEKIERDSYPLDKFICREIPLLEMVKEFGLDDSYIPEFIKNQMNPQTGQDIATPQGQQQPNQQPAQAQQLPQHQQEAPPERFPAENYASLDSIQNIL